MKKTPEQIENELLVLKCQEKNIEAFEKLVARWQKPLWRYAYQLIGSEDAAWDIVQEAWVAIVKGISRLQDAASFPCWAYKIVSNKGIDWIRKKKKRQKLSGDLLLEAQNQKQNRHAGKNEYGSLQAALEHLPGDRRALLSLYYVDGFNINEIAEILDIPEGTVKSRLYHARKELRQLIERC